MSYYADLHIHSKYARATSRDCDAPHLDLWARNKGISLVGTGDFTHPGWRSELREQLVPAGDGLYALKDAYRLPALCAEKANVRFVVSGEISTIYKKDGKTRKVHSVLLLPSLEAADALALRLEQIGNIRSDGRPILGLDCRELLARTLDVCPEALFIPAHIWTPHFSLFGAFSGFDTIEECFGDLSTEIHALETGLSSDPPMNRRLSALDGFTLVSNSDAHSPAKLGREANVLDGAPGYPALARALQTGEGFCGTVEFFPEEGKYHLDGHRACGVRLTPEETERLGGRCPVCGKKLTIGVLHRVSELADRPEGARSSAAKPFVSLVPLPELVGASIGASAAAKRTLALCEKLLRELGTEFHILRDAALADVSRVAGACAAEGLRRLRAGEVSRVGGFDGEYGEIRILTKEERAALQGQSALFASAVPDGAESRRGDAREPARSPEAPRETEDARMQAAALPPDVPNAEQQAAFEATERAIAVIAGPGTGKTKTLVSRIAHLIEVRGVRPCEITAVTFTVQAAAELRARLEARLGGPRAVRGLQLGTFHAICHKLLGGGAVLSEADALSLLSELIRARGLSVSPRAALRAISAQKNGLTQEKLDPELFDAYCARCRALGARDWDDLLLDALSLDVSGRKAFTQLLVDEFQDTNALQRKLVRHWSGERGGLFVIGDADQSIYGFRGASAACFDELAASLPDLRTIRLAQNYRSAPEILEAAEAVISHNPGAPRRLTPMRPACGSVRLVRTEGVRSEAIWISKEIARLAGGVDMLSAHGDAGAKVEAPRPFSDMAVLCRTHKQLLQLEDCLRRDDIPCEIVGRSDTLADPAVQGALLFFRALCEEGNKAALRGCLSLCWGMREDTIYALLSGGSAMDAFCAHGECPAGFVAERALFAPLLHKEKPARLLARWAALHGASEAMERVSALSAQMPDMARFLDALSFGEEADVSRLSGRRCASGAVRLSTLHGAKGLEYPVVFLAGLGEGLLPLARAGETIDLEEERRLLFVGMTRARDMLILTVSGKPSCFCAELPETVRRENAPRMMRETRQLKLF